MENVRIAVYAGEGRLTGRASARHAGRSYKIGWRTGKENDVAKKTKKWTAVEDDQVRAIWVCADCGEEAVIPPFFYEASGEPMCEFCDLQMTYDHCTCWPRVASTVSDWPLRLIEILTLSPGR